MWRWCRKYHCGVVMPLWDISYLGVQVWSRSAVGTWSHCHSTNSSGSKLTHQYIWSKFPQGNWVHVRSMPSITYVLFHLFKVRKSKLGFIKLWPESHAFHRHHHPVIVTLSAQVPSFGSLWTKWMSIRGLKRRRWDLKVPWRCTFTSTWK